MNVFEILLRVQTVFAAVLRCWELGENDDDHFDVDDEDDDPNREMKTMMMMMSLKSFT